MYFLSFFPHTHKVWQLAVWLFGGKKENSAPGLCSIPSSPLCSPFLHAAQPQYFRQGHSEISLFFPHWIFLSGSLWKCLAQSWTCVSWGKVGSCDLTSCHQPGMLHSSWLRAWLVCRDLGAGSSHGNSLECGGKEGRVDSCSLRGGIAAACPEQAGCDCKC